MTSANSDDHLDDEADDIIRSCLDLLKPRSFFLYAGAGSGKTRSLVNAIRYFCRTQGQKLALMGQRVGVITFTNAACDEIKQRLGFDPRVEVSTIHSFAWSLIGGFDNDIRTWLGVNLLAEISELEEQQRRGRPNTKASVDRARAIESKRRRHDTLHEIRRFVYSPTGDNRTRDALNHSEVIAMTATFLLTKPALQQMLVSGYPVLLIDESQDTNRRVMDALLTVQAKHDKRFCLGLFGDTMQRIYAEGKEGLGEAVPASWARPAKRMNHRSSARVIRLINKIRSEDDGQQQLGRDDKPEGRVRLFVLAEDAADKFALEAKVTERMAELCDDQDWTGGRATVKTLTLEHHMAARRFGFSELFEALYPVDRFRTGLLDGSLPGLAFFTGDVLPLIDAMRANDRFRTTAAVRARSPLLDRGRLESAGKEQVALLKTVKQACDSLYALCSGAQVPSLHDILRCIAQSGLFSIPDSLGSFVGPTDAEDQAVAEEDEDAETETVAWRRALGCPLSQVERYDRYVRGISQFDTHQGIKGLEFPRVMVVISDDEARGFLFSYEKLFGAKEKTKADLENEASGRETAIQRTRRLFYVTCSRAERSLAIVYYSKRPELVREAAIERGWFEPSEVELLS
jgi:DNA helicase-2/ATP-dependent DNA helicase PcrA